ncbi:MAG: proline dehydrogenase [Caldithrix sp.]|nr:proline dehydrogenase [Caldithrix sp.]
MSLMDKLVVWSLPLVPKPIVGYFSKTYIAGSKLEDAVRVVKNLNAQNITGTIDLLGEENHKEEDVVKAVDQYKSVLDAIKAEGLDSGISVKPTHMGWMISKEFCSENISELIEKAASMNIFVRIDMEDHTTTTDTIDMYVKLQEQYGDAVGTVIQSYMRRTSDDINYLIKYKANLRLCKGIYNEPREIAYKDMAIINDNFVFNLEKLLKNGCYVGIATHDEKLVWHALRIIEELNLNKDQYEFQMLLGVDEQLRKIIVDAGHHLRVYVPFGEEWYAYSTRRLKENPKMAGHVFRNIFK